MQQIARLVRLERQLSLAGDDGRLERLISEAAEGCGVLDTVVSTVRRRMRRGSSLESLIERSWKGAAPMVVASSRDVVPPPYRESDDARLTAEPPNPTVEAPPIPERASAAPRRTARPPISISTVLQLVEASADRPAIEPLVFDPPVDVSEKIRAHSRAMMERRFERRGQRADYDPFLA